MSTWRSVRTVGWSPTKTFRQFGQLAPGRLDIDVVLGEDRQIEESFAGTGIGESGCRDALQAFERNIFHVLLAACWYVTDERNLRIEAWSIGTRTWDVFIGPFTLRGDEDGQGVGRDRDGDLTGGWGGSLGAPE